MKEWINKYPHVLIGIGISLVIFVTWLIINIARNNARKGSQTDDSGNTSHSGNSGNGSSNTGNTGSNGNPGGSSTNTQQPSPVPVQPGADIPLVQYIVPRLYKTLNEAWWVNFDLNPVWDFYKLNDSEFSAAYNLYRTTYGQSPLDDVYYDAYLSNFAKQLRKDIIDRGNRLLLSSLQV